MFKNPKSCLASEIGMNGLVFNKGEPVCSIQIGIIIYRPGMPYAYIYIGV